MEQPTPVNTQAFRQLYAGTNACTKSTDMHHKEQPAAAVNIATYLIRLATECGEWRCELDSMLRENTRQKNVLAEVVQSGKIKVADHLQNAEEFQTRFIEFEAALKIMRFDVNQQKKKIDHQCISMADDKTELLTRQKILRHDMVSLDEEFQTIRFHFHAYLSAL